MNWSGVRFGQSGTSLVTRMSIELKESPKLDVSGLPGADRFPAEIQPACLHCRELGPRCLPLERQGGKAFICHDSGVQSRPRLESDAPKAFRGMFSAAGPLMLLRQKSIGTLEDQVQNGRNVYLPGGFPYSRRTTETMPFNRSHRIAFIDPDIV